MARTGLIKSLFTGPWNGKHILLMLVIFFGGVIGANALMTYLAVSTFTGVEQPNAYVRGRDYNQVLAQGAAQRALGWQPRLDHRLVERGGRPGVAVRLSLRDQGGAAVPGLKPRATLWRPAGSDLDRSRAMAEATPGTYSATLALPQPGKWQIRISAEGPDGTSLRWHKEVVLTP